MDKQQLINKIKNIEGLTNEEKSKLTELLNTEKKYGLVWEEKQEDIEKRLETELPVLQEVKERAITSSSPDAPNHILIEGDNLEALTALSYTHSGKIDVIYIDPPYNTGNKDFVYNDKFVDREDGYRHSKWLSFMNKRLRIAKGLLSDKGVIFISIDDNEQAQLKLLCDEIFGEKNFVVNAPVIMNLKGNQDEFGFAGTHEYLIVYALSISKTIINQFKINDEEIDNWFEDEIGLYKKGATLKRTGTDAPRSKRPYGYFPILINSQTNSVLCISDEEYQLLYDKKTNSFNDTYIDKLCTKYKNIGFEVIIPTAKGIKTSWRWGFETVKKNKNEILIYSEGNNISLYKKQRPNIGDLPSKKPKSFLYKPNYSSGNGTSLIENILHSKKFNNPKPLDLIYDYLYLSSNRNSTILDFFAGSGTTLHATMQLNNEDGGKRKCILVTNNENGICENVTYERNKRVTNGYTTPKGENIAGLKENSLRYYKTYLLPREKTTANMRRLMHLATDMLCIRNDVYAPAPLAGKDINNDIARYFNDGKRQMLVVYREEAIEGLVKIILKSPPTENRIKTYVFSPNSYAFDEDFYDVADRVELCALPDAIYNAYRHVLPKPEKQYAEKNENNETSAKQ